MPDMPNWSPAVAAGIALALLWIGEALFPLALDRHSTWRRRLTNMGAGLLGYGIAAVALSGVTLGVSLWADKEGVGLLRLVQWPWPVEWLFALLVFDLWAYIWHVWCHRWRPLWRFHVVHHHDEHVDTTTAFRFHVVEIIGKGVLTLPILVVVGATIQQVLMIESITVVVVVFHHANMRLPRWLDRPLCTTIVTPAMHVVHHSRWQPETDSNFGAVFSFWDRLFGTFRSRRDPSAIAYGIEGYEGDDVHTFAGLMRTPFQRIKSEFGRTPQAFLDGTETARPGDPIDLTDGEAGELPLVQTRPAPVRPLVEQAHGRPEQG